MDTVQGGICRTNQIYTTARQREFATHRRRQRQQQSVDGKKIPLQTIYFGGGTPSLAPVETLRLILDTIRAVDGPFSVQAGAEISIEMDPGTFTKEKLQAVKDMGFNRISMGVQVLLVCCYYLLLLSCCWFSSEMNLLARWVFISLHNTH
jgi:coproporphyrinogen III oxidase-like Fe-S oxidoreductase